MMDEKKLWEKCAEFHGHVCGGLTIGYKAALYAIELLELTFSEDERVVCVAENDACGVDAIQVVLGCSVGKGAEITDSVIMPDVVIENGAVIRSAIIAEGCHIKAGARVGDYVEGEERKISVIGKDKIIAEGTVIDAGAIV